MSRKQLKIAVWYNLPHCGAKRALYAHVKGLVEHGHEVEVWTTSTSDRDYLPLTDLAKEHVVPLEPRWRSPGNPLSALLQPYQDTMFNMAAMQKHCRACAAQIEEGDFDLAFVNQCAGYGTSFLGRFLTLPKVLYLQDPLRALYEATPSLPWMAPPFAKTRLGKYTPRALHNALYDALCVSGLRTLLRYEWENARTYDTVLVNSYFSRESVARAYGITSDVCYLGIDTTHFSPNESVPREDFILGIGQIAPRKNLELAIEALSLLPSPRPRLVWIGNAADTPYLESLQSQAQQSGVTFEPRLRVSDEELMDALRRARFVLYVPKLEPFGLAPLEANACGAPVVGVREGGLRETIRHEENGLLADPNPRSLAAAIQRLWNNPELAAQMGRRGREMVVREWNEPDAIGRLEEHLHRTLDERQPLKI